MAQDSQIVCPTVEECRQISPSLIKHVLVPFDQSSMAHRAFEFALDLAKKHNAKISVLTVLYSNSLSSSFLDMNPHQNIIERQKLETLSNSFRQMSKISKKFNVKISSEVVFSRNVADSILSFCSQHKVDVIAMGTRARNGPKRFMVGSVALDVVQRSSCPTILVK